MVACKPTSAGRKKTISMASGQYGFVHLLHINKSQSTSSPFHHPIVRVCVCMCVWGCFMCSICRFTASLVFQILEVIRSFCSSWFELDSAFPVRSSVVTSKWPKGHCCESMNRLKQECKSRVVLVARCGSNCCQMAGNRIVEWTKSGENFLKRNSRDKKFNINLVSVH